MRVTLTKQRANPRLTVDGIAGSEGRFVVLRNGKRGRKAKNCLPYGGGNQAIRLPGGKSERRSDGDGAGRGPAEGDVRGSETEASQATPVLGPSRLGLIENGPLSQYRIGTGPLAQWVSWLCVQ
jgi:hypothetical protein